MEYLRKAMEHRFWILVGIALLLPTVGWAMASGSLKSETDSRTSKLTRVEKQIADLRIGAQPNQGWEQAVASQKNELQKSVDLAWEELYVRQEPEPWPGDVLAEMKKLGAGHPQVRSLYRDRYSNEVDETYRLVEPAEMQFNLLRFALDDWGGGVPSAQEMLDAQEDVRVERAVLKVISETNKPAETIEMAPIKSVDFLAIGDEVRDPAPTNVSQGMAAARSAGRGGRALPERYVVQTDQYKLMRIELRLTMDHQRVPDLLEKFGSSPIPIEVTQISMFEDQSGGLPGIRAGANSSADSMLAEVEIYGNIFLFKPPPSLMQQAVVDGGQNSQAANPGAAPQ